MSNENKPITAREAVQIFLTLSKATSPSAADTEINYPPEKEPSHKGIDLAICYAVAWAEYLLALTMCVMPITQECVDQKYDVYCDEILTCESNWPE